MNDIEFETAVMAGPIVDNANDRLWGPNGQYDGPRCAADDCTAPVENDGEMCDPCGDRPHQFIHDGGYRDHWCICGRFYSATIHGDEERGDR